MRPEIWLHDGHGFFTGQGRDLIVISALLHVIILPSDLRIWEVLACEPPIHRA
jgi:hypothetical protein